MAGNVNFVPMSSYDLEGQEIARRRKMAEMLQAQSMAPIEQQSVGGMVAPFSVTQGLAKLLQGYSARKGQEAADEESKALGTRYQADLTNTLQRAQEAMTGAPATVAEDAMGNGSAIPERKPDRNAYISALMAHPATMPLALQAQQKEIERQAQAAQLAQILGMGNQATNPGAGAALAAEQAAGGAAGPTTAAAARLPAAPGPVGTGMGQVSPQAIALMLQGGPLAEIGKTMQAAQGEANKPIAARENAPIVVPDGQGGFRVAFSPAPKLDQGMTYDFGNRSVSVAPGFIPSMTAIEGARTGAVEAAKAPYQLVDVPQSDGSTRRVPLPQAQQMLGGGAAQPMTQPAGRAAPDARFQGMGDPRNDAGRAQILAREVADQASRGAVDPALRREVEQFNRGRPAASQVPLPSSGQAPVVGRTPTAAEKAAQENTAIADRERMQMEGKRTFNMTGLSDLINTADGILSGTAGRNGQRSASPTSSAIGSAVDTAAGWFGAAPPGAAQADQLRAIAGALTAKMPRMEGPQSDKDVQLYKEMAGAVGDATLPIARRKAALGVVRQLWQQYEGQQPRSTLTAPPDPVVPSRQPAAPASGGKRITVDW